jgi:hypothetical protein
VQLFVNGLQVGTNIALPASGIVNLPLGSLPAGTNNAANIVVDYSGSPDLEYGASGSSPGTLYALQVAQAPITLTANNATTTYGTGVVGSTNGSSTAFAITSGGPLPNGETIGAVTMTVALTTPTIVGTYPPAGTTNEWVGIYSVTPSAATGGSGFKASNYAITYAPGTLTVNPTPLTITANDQTLTYGSVDNLFGAGSTQFTVSPATFPNNQTAASLTVTVTCNGGTCIDGLPTMAAGIYPGFLIPIAPAPIVGNTNFNAGNYTITTNAGTLTISALPVVLTGTESYTGSTAVAGSILTVQNVVNSDIVTVGGTATLASASVGTEPITAASFSTPTLTLGGAQAGNYTLSGGSGSVVVTASLLQPFLITSNYLTGGNLEICWQSVNGQTYNVLTNTVLTTNGLPTNGWVEDGAVSPVTATGTNTCVTIPGPFLTNIFVLIKQ